MKRRCVFLDRDGVINQPASKGLYINHWSEFHLLANAVDWIRIFNALEFLVIVVTNQRGVALGVTDSNELATIHRNMVKDLATQGARIDDIFHCPHDHGMCDCRKPLPGMVLQAAGKWNIDLKTSLMIGDTEVDRQLAQNCGLRFLRASGDGHILSDMEAAKT